MLQALLNINAFVPLANNHVQYSLQKQKKTKPLPKMHSSLCTGSFYISSSTLCFLRGAADIV